MVQQKITTFLNKYPSLARAELGKKLNNFNSDSNLQGEGGFPELGRTTSSKQTNKRKVYCGGGEGGGASQTGQGSAKKIIIISS